MKKIMIAVPCMDTVPVTFVEAMMRLKRPEGTALCFQKNSLVYDGRNLLSLKAINEGYDYVFWLDSDMVPPADTIQMLLDDMMEYQVDMVTGLYLKRSFPPVPVLYDDVHEPTIEEGGNVSRCIREYMDYPRDRIFPVKGCGFGCVMTSVPLLKRVWDKYWPAFNPYPWAGEDVSFCHRVNQLGHTILCDSRVKCGHIGHFIYTESLLGQGGGNGGEN